MTTRDIALQAIEASLDFAHIRCAAEKKEAPGVVIVVWAKGWSNSVIYTMVELGPPDLIVKTYGWDFRQIAIDKKDLSKRTGLPSHIVVYERPWLLEDGDILYGGSYCEDGSLIVAVSGSTEDVDIKIATHVFNQIREIELTMIEEAKKNGRSNL